MPKFLLLAAAASLLLCTGAARKPAFDLRIHATGTEAEVPTFAYPTTLLNGTPAFLQRMPLLTQREVVSVFPFNAADGSMGTYLKLGAHGSNLLQQLTSSRAGTTLVVLLNGRQVSNLLVDRAIGDGIVCIPRGLTPDDIEFLTTVFPVTGQEGKKKRR